eukprot:CAMPEP_0175784808 /NCGR_PEP_ID=MMETSP0097-20121207/79002_1 /TAXON_ID=311494 /ORGANISM="Alexandrium monilatum, Strain CCMP3105" /LENGTH=140 /DNA_ID=CAMNT_0017095697 /DNA_START=211 /DNA_END=633 /DNA_ORIENTATION=-
MWNWLALPELRLDIRVVSDRLRRRPPACGAVSSTWPMAVAIREASEASGSAVGAGVGPLLAEGRDAAEVRAAGRKIRSSAPCSAIRISENGSGLEASFPDSLCEYMRICLSKSIVKYRWQAVLNHLALALSPLALESQEL